MSSGAQGAAPAVPAVPSVSTPGIAPILVRISVPSIGVQKTLRASPLDSVWNLKQQISDKVATEIRDSLNYGIHQASTGGKVGRFLEEKRDLASYQLENNVSTQYFDILIECTHSANYVVHTGIYPKKADYNNSVRRRRGANCKKPKEVCG
jgi:hypothetical protein